MNTQKKVVLAFSGGLDTSFCVPYLIENGFKVITLFVHTGSISDQEIQRIAQRAQEVGADEHVAVDAGQDIWDSVVTPMIMGGVKYQDQYPLLCSDRYVIAAESVKLAHERGAHAIAHGCTAMGNDQVRFDQTIHTLSELPILAPIRDIMAHTKTPRLFEMNELAKRGIKVSQEAKQYTINENLLGTTLSGSEIDEMGSPGSGTYKLTKPAAHWPRAPLRVAIGFDRGRVVTLDGKAVDGPRLLSTLNTKFGAYGVGRGIYTGDTIVGLKGRIVFECPGLEVLLVAHKAIEELVLTKSQNGFKPVAARKWTELVFGGMFYEPLRADLELFIRSSQQTVTGEVVIESSGGVCLPVEVHTQNALIRSSASYAQYADWSPKEAEGFIKIHGQSSSTGALTRARTAANSEDQACCVAY